jgi:hypothetical protein
MLDRAQGTAYNPCIHLSGPCGARAPTGSRPRRDKHYHQEPQPGIGSVAQTHAGTREVRAPRWVVSVTNHVTEPGINERKTNQKKFELTLEVVTRSGPSMRSGDAVMETVGNRTGDTGTPIIVNFCGP